MEEIFDDLISKFWKDERTQALQRYAEQHNYPFIKRQKLHEQPFEILDFLLFSGKKGKRFKSIISWQGPVTDLNCRVYDYLYFAESNKKHTTVFEFQHPKLDLYPFCVRPKRNIKWVKEVFGAGKEKMYPELLGFHSYYEVISDDPIAVENHVPKEFMDLISQKDRIWVEGSRQHMLVYYRNRKIPINKLDAKFEEFLTLFEILINDQHLGSEFV